MASPESDLPQGSEPKHPHRGLSDSELADLLNELRAEYERRTGKPAERRPSFFPRPPRIETAADFIVIIFACMVSVILFALTIGLIVAAFKGGDIKSYFAVITSIMTSVISALVGYLAGRSQNTPPPPPPTGMA